jgi:Prolipoprotein diacylglyceryl transferase
VFALYVIFYTLGRFWIEALRIDQVNEIGGFRLNNYTSLILFLAALGWFLWLVKNRPGREEVVEADFDRSPALAEADEAERGPSLSKTNGEQQRGDEHDRVIGSGPDGDDGSATRSGRGDAEGHKSASLEAKPESP